MKVVQDRLQPLVPPKEEWLVISEIMGACFSYDASKRPTFDSICKSLQQLDDSLLKPNMVNLSVPAVRETKDDIRKFTQNEY